MCIRDRYALLAGESLSGNARDIIINLDGDKTVQIKGDIAIYNYHPNGVLVNLERTNFRHITEEQMPEAIDFASVDVSFISLP